MPPPGTTNTKQPLVLLNGGSAGEDEGSELDPGLLDEDDEFEDETWFDKATAGTIFVVVVLAITSTLVSGIEIYAAMNLTGYTIPLLGEANMSTVRWRYFLYDFGVPSRSRPSSFCPTPSSTCAVCIKCETRKLPPQSAILTP
jgi:hypothetical protein